MKAIIKKSSVKGQVVSPPSKSFAHRLLICSALSNGECVVKGVANSQDMTATLSCLSSLGISFVRNCDMVTFTGKKASKSYDFYAGESASTLRFFIPIALLFNSSATFYGTEKLISRGIQVYQEVFKDKGVSFDVQKDHITVNGTLASGNYVIRGDSSSQYLSGLFFALPLVDGDSTIEITSTFESKSYAYITLSVLKQFGINIECLSENKFYIPGNQKYQPISSVVEGDWSNGAFFYALKYMGESLEILGLNDNSIQGDRVCKPLMERLSSPSCTVDEVIDIMDCPDLAPILFVFAGCNNGATFINTRRLRVKESDRAKSMQQELIKCGINLIVEENSVKVFPVQNPRQLEQFEGHNDHRIVMALSVLLTRIGGVINGISAVNKSFPNFFEVLESLGVETIYEQ